MILVQEVEASRQACWDATRPQRAVAPENTKRTETAGAEEIVGTEVLAETGVVVAGVSTVDQAGVAARDEVVDEDEDEGGEAT